MIIYLGLAAVAVGVLGLRALFLGVCEHLEADDMPSAAREQRQVVSPTMSPARSPQPSSLASAARRVASHPRLHLSARR